MTVQSAAATGLWQLQTLRLRCRNLSSLPEKSLMGGGRARAPFAGVLRPAPIPSPLQPKPCGLQKVKAPRALSLHSPHQKVLWENSDTVFCPIPKKPERKDRGDPGGKNTGAGEATRVQKYQGTAAPPAMAELGTKLVWMTLTTTAKPRSAPNQAQRAFSSWVLLLREAEQTAPLGSQMETA